MTTTRPTLASAWAEFERVILDPMNASRVQRREMRRAWYAGADQLFGLLIQHLDPDGEPTADDLAYVSSLAAELAVFGRHIQEGIA